MTILLCILALAFSAALLELDAVRYILTLFLTLTLLITICYLIGYFNSPLSFITHSF